MMRRLDRMMVGAVARLPFRVQTKLLAAFLAIAALLIVVGAAGLQVLTGVNERTVELIRSERKIAAYRQVQHDTTSQLYRVTSALLANDDRSLDSALRQLNQFGAAFSRYRVKSSSAKSTSGASPTRWILGALVACAMLFTFGNLAYQSVVNLENVLGTVQVRNDVGSAPGVRPGDAE